MRSPFTRNTSAITAGLAVFLLSLTSDSATVAAPQQFADETVYLPTFSYAQRRTRGIKLVPNYRIAEASGEAKVERKSGMTEIEIELDEMKTALHFGGNFATYVLWAVSPEGHASNLGEFVLKGNRSKLNVSTYLQTFGLMVTAEPHFMVESPSRFIVLSNESDENLEGEGTASIRYVGDEGTYRYTNTRLGHAPESSGEVRTEIRQANVAIQLAERAGAAEHAPSDFRKAHEALNTMILAVEDGSIDRTGGALAHEAIRLAARAEKAAIVSGQAAAVATERVQFAHRITQLNAELDATKLTLEREMASARGHGQTLEIALEEARVRTEETLGKILETERTAEGLIVSLPGVFFDSDRATLKPETREVLSRVAGILQLIPGFQLQVEGHSDSTGATEYNRTLSLQRASSVQSYFISAGVHSGRISVNGLGETQPVESNQTAEGRSQNRPVDLVIVEGGRQTARN
jgi:outer membrane protein OmpA-like peptidoglycan-associated protein